jgi:sigma-B regulation protein RsbU (phosphoserine phosphatase)
VTDKEFGPALFMAPYRACCGYEHGDYLGEGQAQDDPTALLLNTVTRTNRYVCQTHARPLFATLFIGVLDPQTGRVSYINAGQDPPLILRDGHSQQELAPTGPGLGILEEMDYRAGETTIAPGEMLLIYSDGVKDVQDGSGAFFGGKRLLELVALPAASATELVERISASLFAFRGDSPPYDDVTLLAIKRN